MTAFSRQCSKLGHQPAGSTRWRQFGSLTGDGFSRSNFINDNSALSLRRLETEAQRLGPIFTF
jgi:hypothetical protein